MSVKLSEIMSEEATAKAKLGQLEIGFTYKPNAVTAEMAFDLNADKVTMVKVLADVLVDWEVVVTKGQPYPPTEANLMKSPIRLLTAISAAIATGDDEGEASGSFGGS